MKVLLTHGYFLSEDPKEREIMRPYVPLGILYLSAWLKRKRIDTAVFDTTFSTPQALQDYLRTHRPPFVGIYVNLMTKKNVLAIIRFIRGEESLKHTRIILGGPEVRYHDERLLRYGADFIVYGEGEQTMEDLVTTLDSAFNPFLDTIDGIGFINMRGEMVRTKEREKMKDIDRLPFPDRKAIDLDLYFKAWKGRHGQSAASISTMRGCPYTCKWCSRGVYGLSYRRRSAALVVEELEWVQANYAVDTFWFVDDVFTISHKWLGEFVAALEAAEVKVRYECITRADRMNEEVIDLLAQSGCFRVWIGAESGSQRVLDAMDRRVDADKVRAMIQAAQAKGIQAGTFIMLGYPGETEADIVETVDHLALSAPDLFTITVAYPIKGTALYEEVEAQLTTDLSWEEGSDRDLDFPRTYPRRYYDHAVRWVFNEVNARIAFGKRQWSRALRHKAKSVGARLRMALAKGKTR
jgi:anaerobic magnesium-protoporphyrin IX monomethyl ester cyclase